MATQDGFPRELLSQPKLERLTYFKNKLIKHPHLEEVHNSLIRAIREPAGASMIMVYGPTGVGKTTLLGRIQAQVLQESLPELEKDAGRMPIGLVTAASPEMGNFNWKDFYVRSLNALNEPLVENKIDHDLRASRFHSETRFGFNAHSSVPELRRALEQCLHHRRLIAFIIDDAQHLKKMASGRRLLDQMDTLKSLADLTGVVFVLAGTYEMLDLTNLSAQLSRRSIDIHFSRYRYDNVDVEIFRTVLRTFQVHLPVATVPNLEERLEFLYERSAGCVGVLKGWLDQTLAAALEDDQKTLTTKYLERYALPSRKLAAMVREIADGEAELVEKDGKHYELRAQLGMDSNPVQDEMAKPPIGTLVLKRPRGRVGQRNPVRDQVGAEEHVF
jgi:hypothetical protein